MHKAVIKIQPGDPKLLESGVVNIPYPYFIDEHGRVLQQDLWNNKPYRFLGTEVNRNEGVIDLFIEAVDQDKLDEFIDRSNKDQLPLVFEDKTDAGCSDIVSHLCLYQISRVKEGVEK